MHEVALKALSEETLRLLPLHLAWPVLLLRWPFFITQQWVMILDEGDVPAELRGLDVGEDGLFVVITGEAHVAVQGVVRQPVLLSLIVCQPDVKAVFDAVVGKWLLLLLVVPVLLLGQVRLIMDVLQ